MTKPNNFYCWVDKYGNRYFKPQPGLELTELYKGKTQVHPIQQEFVFTDTGITNVKAMLVEKERIAYIENNPALANFFDATLRYILDLEECINEKDKELETLNASDTSAG
jgi:hypothetical protein